jgi:hypothetical protein
VSRTLAGLELTAPVEGRMAEVLTSGADSVRARRPLERFAEFLTLPAYELID